MDILTTLHLASSSLQQTLLVGHTAHRSVSIKQVGIARLPAGDELRTQSAEWLILGGAVRSLSFRTLLHHITRRLTCRILRTSQIYAAVSQPSNKHMYVCLIAALRNSPVCSGLVLQPDKGSLLTPNAVNILRVDSRCLASYIESIPHAPCIVPACMLSVSVILEFINQQLQQYPHLAKPSYIPTIPKTLKINW